MKKEEDMLDKEEDMLDMSPGGLYPTNRVVSVEQRWGKCLCVSLHRSRGSVPN